MLSKLRVQHYKSLFDTEVELEPLTVFIGPNGSGKSNICEALAVLSDFLQRLISDINNQNAVDFFSLSLSKDNKNFKSKFWQGKQDYIFFEVSDSINEESENIRDKINKNISFEFYYDQKEVFINYSEYPFNNYKDKYTTGLRQHLVPNYYDSIISRALKKVNIYDFAPDAISNQTSSKNIMDRSGQGIALALVDILHENREAFDELEERFTQLVPNIKRIALPRVDNQKFSLKLIDKYSNHHIPPTDISDGTLRILAFLTALYQTETPSIICFEELENGVHPWLLNKMIELLQIVSTEGITGKPVQVLITTHSPLLLNYVKPHQVRAVELDKEGKTQVHKLPTESARFQKALEAYDGALGELWFTNVFGGNPE